MSRRDKRVAVPARNRPYGVPINLSEAANEILSMGLAHMFASDAHSCHSRTPHMGELRRWVEDCCDEDYASILLEHNPSRLLQGRPMVGMDI